MAVTSRLREEWRKSDESYAYYDEVVRRLEEVVGTWLSLTDCRALAHVLECNLVLYDDGFVIGQDQYGNDMLLHSSSSAAVLARCFLDPKKYNLRRYGPSALWPALLSHKDQLEAQSRIDALIQQIARTPGVQVKPKGAPLAGRHEKLGREERWLREIVRQPGVQLKPMEL